MRPRWKEKVIGAGRYRMIRWTQKIDNVRSLQLRVGQTFNILQFKQIKQRFRGMDHSLYYIHLWYGHMEHMSGEQLTKRVYESEVE